MEMESKIAEMDREAIQAETRPGTPSRYSCPDRQGVLWEIKDGKFIRFRCRIGHAFSPESMLAGQKDVFGRRP